MFNRLNSFQTCGKCKKTLAVETQFTYGNVNANEYEVGDSLLWGKTEIGTKAKHVLVSGDCECPACENQWFADIEVLHNKITSIKVHCDSRLYPDSLDEFIVLEE